MSYSSPSMAGPAIEIAGGSQPWPSAVHRVVAQIATLGWSDTKRDYSSSIGELCASQERYKLWDLKHGSELEIMWDHPPEAIRRRLLESVGRNRSYLNDAQRTDNENAPGFQLWFFGASDRDAKATVLIMDKNEIFRKRMKRIIRKSKILEEYNIHLRAIAREKIEFLGGSAEDTKGVPGSGSHAEIDEQSSSWCGVSVLKPAKVDGMYRKATVSCTILIEQAGKEDLIVALTVAHPFLIDTESISINYANTSDKEYFDDVFVETSNEMDHKISDTDSSGDEYEDDEWEYNETLRVMKRISPFREENERKEASQKSEAEIIEASRWQQSIEGEPWKVLPQGIVVGQVESAQKFQMPGKKDNDRSLIMSKKMTLDWAVIELSDPVSMAVNNIIVPSGVEFSTSTGTPMPKNEINLTKISTQLLETDIWAILGSQGLVGGKRLGSIASIQLGPGGDFKEVWSVRLWQTPETGDSGSLVINAANHEVIGAIVAQQQGLGLVYVLPISDTFKEIQSLWNCKVRLPSLLDVTRCRLTLHRSKLSQQGLVPLSTVVASDLLNPLLSKRATTENPGATAVGSISASSKTENKVMPAEKPATPSYQKSLKEKEPPSGVTGHILTADPIENLGDLFRSQGKSQGTETMYQQMWDEFEIRAKDKDRSTVLHKAIEGGHEAIERLLVKNEADIHAKDQHGSTVLHKVAELQQESMVRLLIDRGADVHAKDGSGLTVLHKAVELQQESMVRLLIDRGADVHAEDGSGLTVLHKAVELQQESMVRLLEERGANVQPEDSFRKMALLNAASGGHEALVRLLLENGADIQAEDGSGSTSLHKAVDQQREFMVRLLVERGADIQAKDIHGKTALHISASRGREAPVRLLLENGADVRVTDEHGATALHKAASRGHGAVVRLLLESGADVSVKDIYGATALHDAAIGGHEAAVRLLLEHGADVWAKDKKYGATALHKAASKGHEAAVQLLVQNGADVWAKNSDGATALHDAASRGHKVIIRLLLENRADVLVKDNHGVTVLHDAAIGGYEVAVRLLLENGADVRVTDNYGATALELAQSRRDTYKARGENGPDFLAVVHLLESASFPSGLSSRKK